MDQDDGTRKHIEWKFDNRRCSLVQIKLSETYFVMRVRGA